MVDQMAELARLRRRVAQLEARPATDGGPIEPAPVAQAASRPEQLDMLLAAMEATRTPMVVSDPRRPDNPIMFANRAFQQLSGYPLDEIVGRNCRFLQGPGTDPADVAAIRDAIRERHEVTRDLLNYRKDGTVFVNELHIRPVFDEDGELRYFFASQTDLARYRSDWRRLMESEERYRSLFEAIDAGFCIFEMIRDTDGRPIDYRFVEVNPAFERQTGIAHAPGRRMGEIAPDHERHWFETYGEVDRLRRGVRFEDEARALGRHYEVHAYPVGQPDQHRVAALFTDITRRKRVEADLRALTGTLEQQVAERTRELTEAGEALRQSQKMEAIGQLTGGVAHDFNNLLTIIRSAAEFLRRPDLPPERHDRYVEAIVGTADRAANLTGQLLAFARRQPLKAEPFDVGERVAAVAELVRTMVGHGIELVVEKGAPGAHVANADPGQLDNAVVNLAVNARDAMNGRGRLRLAVRAADELPAMRQHQARPGRFVAIEVEDSGPGIAAGDLVRIFEPFFTTKGVGQGTGLGLSQVYGFAKQSGGDVGVETSPAGTRFTVYGPAAAAPPAGGAGGGTGGTRFALGEGACILVVEDNAEVGRFSTELLHDLGFRTAWVEDAPAALAALAAAPGRFQLVLSDVMMPGMNGVELAREMRRLHPDLPVVLTSGYSSVLADEGTDGLPLVRKPYSIGTLGEAISEVLRARREA